MFHSSPLEALSFAELEPRGNKVSTIEKVLLIITATIIMPVYIRLKQESKRCLSKCTYLKTQKIQSVCL